MRLVLSSAVAPSAPLDELMEAAARRGMAGVELVSGHAAADRRGVGADPGPGADAVAAPAPVMALLEAEGTDADVEGHDLGALARELGVPALVRCSVDGGPGPGEALDRVGEIRRAGAEAMVLLPTAGLETALDALPADEPVAWDADPRARDLTGPGAWLLDGAGARLRHVRLRGGGPEAVEQEGRGVGSLMARLAVAGYAGTVALAPSGPRYRVIWDAWLGRRGGWGCGSRSEDRTLVTLGGVG
jgi:hypothetical protein